MTKSMPTYVFGVLLIIVVSMMIGSMGCKEKVPEPESDTASSAEPVVECSSKAYKAGSTDKEKQEALDALLKQQTPECTKSYYELAESADEKDKPAFKAALFLYEASGEH